jgi:hypothetical protein
MRGAVMIAMLCAATGARAETHSCFGDRDCTLFEECNAQHVCVARDAHPEAQPADPAARGRTLAGFGSFFAGFGGLFVGVGLGATGPLDADKARSGYGILALTGCAVFGVGFVLTAAGVPLWATGARDAKRAKAKAP